MWICKRCGSEIETKFVNAEVCWKCGWGKDGSPPRNPELYEETGEEAVELGMSGIAYESGREPIAALADEPSSQAAEEWRPGAGDQCPPDMSYVTEQAITIEPKSPDPKIGWREYLVGIDEERPTSINCINDPDHVLSSTDIVCPSDSTLQLAESPADQRIFFYSFRILLTVCVAWAGFLNTSTPIFVLVTTLAAGYLMLMTRHHPRLAHYFGLLGLPVLLWGYVHSLGHSFYLPAEVSLPLFALATILLLGLYTYAGMHVSVDPAHDPENLFLSCSFPAHDLFLSKVAPALLLSGVASGIWYGVLSLSIGGMAAVGARWLTAAIFSALGFGLLVSALLWAFARPIHRIVAIIGFPAPRQVISLSRTTLGDPGDVVLRAFIQGVQTSLNALERSAEEVVNLIAQLWHQLKVCIVVLINAIHRGLCVLWLRTVFVFSELTQIWHLLWRAAFRGFVFALRLLVLPLAVLITVVTVAILLSHLVLAYIQSGELTAAGLAIIYLPIVFISTSIPVSCILRKGIVLGAATGFLNLTFVSLPFLLLVSYSLAGISYYFSGPFKVGPLTIIATGFYVVVFIYTVAKGKMSVARGG